MHSFGSPPLIHFTNGIFLIYFALYTDEIFKFNLESFEFHRIGKLKNKKFRNPPLLIDGTIITCTVCGVIASYTDDTNGEVSVLLFGMYNLNLSF